MHGLSKGGERKAESDSHQFLERGGGLCFHHHLMLGAPILGDEADLDMKAGDPP